MPFIAAVRHEAHPDQADALLAVLRDDYAVSAARYPGRRFARLFQRRRQPSRMLAIEEWQSQDDFDAHAAAPAYATAVAACGAPARATPLERLQHYRHLPHPLTALSCASVSAPPERAAEVERFICDQQRRDALVAGGLALRAVYRVTGSPGELLVLHGWRTLADLDAYLATSEQNIADALTPFEAAVDQFAAELVAQFSWLDG